MVSFSMAVQYLVSFHTNEPTKGVSLRLLSLKLLHTLVGGLLLSEY